LSMLIKVNQFSDWPGRLKLALRYSTMAEDAIMMSLAAGAG